MSYGQALEEQIHEQRKWASDYGANRAGPGSMLASHFPQPGQARMFMVDHLKYAETYFVAPAIGAIVASSAATLSKETRAPAIPPSRVGWLWFSQPIRVPGLRVFPDRTCMTPEVRAISWAMTERETSGRVYARLDGAPEVGAIPHSYSLLTYFDCDQGEHIDLVVIDAWPLDETVGDTEPIDRDDMEPDALEAGEGIAPFVRRVFFALCAFIEQRILTAGAQRPERATRKRLEREGVVHEPLIRVVELRRAQSRSEARGEADPVAWSHQWIVSGHWRQQWYPSLNDHRPRWVMPYIKGPDDKPLKPPRAKVFAVVR